MVKNLNITLDDNDYDLLLAAKKDKSWRAFIMELADRELNGTKE